MAGLCLPNSAGRYLFEISGALFVEMAKELATETNIALGCDGTTTYFDRSGFEVHLSYGERTELLCIDDLVDKNAEGYLAAILVAWDKRQKNKRD